MRLILFIIVFYFYIWVQTNNQQADILTKCLSTKLFIDIVSQNLLTDSD